MDDESAAAKKKKGRKPKDWKDDTKQQANTSGGVHSQHTSKMDDHNKKGNN